METKRGNQRLISTSVRTTMKKWPDVNFWSGAIPH